MINKGGKRNYLYAPYMRMKLFFTILILLTSLCSRAQNYQCLQGGVKHYFINSNGYLRGIRIDSVTATGDTIVYYPNHTPRGAYSTSGGALSLDSNGGSWLGKRVLQKSDGTFIFDSYWGDSVVIKTQAGIGDSWVFYMDTSSLYYTATLVSKDTLTVLSSPDSVQTILINAVNGSGIVATDPLNGLQIILSKNHGFVQVCDLYTFPYHKPDSSYRPGLDFFLDRSTCNYNNIITAPGFAPDSSVALFRITDFISPNDWQLHSWNISDVIGSFHSFTMYPYAGGDTYTNDLWDTVTNKVISGHAVSYTFSGSAYACSNFSDPCNLIIHTGTVSYYDTVYSIADTSFMPEENLYAQNYVFYFPADTGRCVASPAYITTPVNYTPGAAVPLQYISYKTGIGETYNQFSAANHLLLEWNGLTNTTIAGNSCGSAVTSVPNTVANAPVIMLVPNPARASITITSSAIISQVSIINTLGQSVYSGNCNARTVQINIAGLPQGIYLAKINGDVVKRFVKE